MTSILTNFDFHPSLSFVWWSSEKEEVPPCGDCHGKAASCSKAKTRPPSEVVVLYQYCDRTVTFRPISSSPQKLHAEIDSTHQDYAGLNLNSSHQQSSANNSSHDSYLGWHSFWKTLGGLIRNVFPSALCESHIKNVFWGLGRDFESVEAFEMTSYCKKSIRQRRIFIDDWKLFFEFTDKKTGTLPHKILFPLDGKKCIMLYCKKVIVLSRTKESVIFSKNAIKIWYIKYIKYTRNNILFSNNQLKCDDT